MRTENDIRTVLATLADDTPDPEGMLATVRASAPSRSRTGRTRPLVGVAIATALAAVAIPVIIDAISQRDDGGPAGLGRPANPLWQHRFSVQPPPGFAIESTHLSRTRERALIGRSPAGWCLVDVYVPGAFDTRILPADRVPIASNGKRGWYARFADKTAGHAAGAMPRIAWQYATNSWALVVCGKFRPDTDVKALALEVLDGLTIEPRKLPVPFTVGYLPAAMRVVEAHPAVEGRYENFSVVATDVVKKPSTADREIGVSFEPVPRPTGTSSPPPPVRPGSTATPFRIDGRDGVLVRSDDSVTVTINGDGFRIVIAARTNLFANTEAELLEIAKGLRIADDPADKATWFDGTTAIP